MRSFPSDLSAKVQQSLQTLGNSGQPTLKIAASRAKTTVTDANYWTVETIREKAGLGDISIAPRRFLKHYGGPDRLYDIHIESGQVHTAIREYPDKLKQGWKPQFQLGPGIAVAIAFDGYWERHRKLWRLATDEKPWIFWVDSTGILWGQHWDAEDTKIELATGVKGVKAIRAWKNVNIFANDQGIVVGYIKTDGKLYYRNYCQQADYSSLFESERQLTAFTGVAVNLNLFLTNDYRMGFSVQDSTNNIHWIITHRNWAGMALERDNISVSAIAEVAFVPVTYRNAYEAEQISIGATADVAMLFGRTDNSLIELRNVEVNGDWGFGVIFKLNFPTETLPTVTLNDATTLSLFTTSIVQITKTEFQINVDSIAHEFGFNSVEGALKVSISTIVNEAGVSYADIIQEFTPINLVPPFIPLPEVEVIWNE